MDPFIFTLTGTVLVLLLLGAALSIFKIPHVVAYVLAGIALGPHGMGLVKDITDVKKYESLGIIFLLFFAGLKIQFSNLLGSWKIAIIGTLVQILLCLICVYGVGAFLDWPLNRVVLLGFIISLSSTAIVIKMLEEWGESGTKSGQVAISILIAQDTAIIPMVMILDIFQGGQPTPRELIYQLIGGTFIVGILAWIGYRGKIRLPWGNFFIKNHELQVFAALSLCFGLALTTEMFHLSAALGAFVAGIIVGSATEINWVHQKLEPFYIFFVAIFFVHIGMLLEPSFLLQNIGIIVFLVLASFLVKTVLNFGLFYAFGMGQRNGLYTGALLSQIGEFGFVLIAIGMKSEIIGKYEFQLAISVISLSLLVSPLWIHFIKKLNTYLDSQKVEKSSILARFKKVRKTKTKSKKVA
jgi:CPA2 family monovalent cation:H+ antiporter-2